MSISYKETSVYRKTPLNKKYLENYVPPITPNMEATEVVEVTKKYEYRPDLLAYDRYGDAAYWWVFVLYNRNILLDPIYDMKTGTKIRVPISISSMGG